MPFEARPLGISNVSSGFFEKFRSTAAVLAVGVVVAVVLYMVVGSEFFRDAMDIARHNYPNG